MIALVAFDGTGGSLRRHCFTHCNPFTALKTFVMRRAESKRCRHEAPKAPSSSNTRRNASELARRSRQARRPASAPAAGIDAASMARRCQNPLQKLRMFFSTSNQARCVRVGRGSDRQARPARRGWTSPVRQPRHSARPDGERAEDVEATEPAEFGRPGRIPMHGDARETSPGPPWRSPRQRPARSVNRQDKRQPPTSRTR